MAELTATIQTDADFASRSIAERVAHFLFHESRWTPERYGECEPLRSRFDLESVSEFVDMWSEPNGNLCSLHFVRRRVNRYGAAVIWWRDRSNLGSLHISMPVRARRAETAYDLLDLVEQLFPLVHGQYAHVCTRAEFYEKNIDGAWVGPDGEKQGGSARGVDLRVHLPGLYWANLFGPAYVVLLGHDKLVSAPAHEIRRHDGFFTLLNSPDPYSWADPEVSENEDRVRRHIGSSAFYSREERLENYCAPDFDLGPR